MSSRVWVMPLSCLLAAGVSGAAVNVASLGATTHEVSATDEIWKFFAAQQGLLGEPRVPLASLVLSLCAAILIANVIAVFPGRTAGGLPTA